MGRPLPGSPEIRLAAYDLKADRLVLAEDGFVRECGWDEIGLLLARARPGETAEADPMRGVFARDDAWLSTGDLFRRDDEGDYWRVDSLRDVIYTEHGPMFTAPIRDALSDLPAVDLAVAYGWRPREGKPDIAVAAVTLRPGHELAPEDLASLPAYARAAVVRVVDSLPVTTWYRPLTAPLREAGLPGPGEGPAWYLDRGGRRYRRLSEAARRRLTGGG